MTAEFPQVRPSRTERLAVRLGVPRSVAAFAMVALIAGTPSAALVGWTLGTLQLPAQPARVQGPPIAETTPPPAPPIATTPPAPEPARTRAPAAPTVRVRELPPEPPAATTGPTTAPVTSSAEPTAEPTSEVPSTQDPTPTPGPTSEPSSVSPPTALEGSVSVELDAQVGPDLDR